MKGKTALLGLGTTLIIYLLNPVKKDAVVLNPPNQPEKADKSTIDAVVQGNYAPHINGIRIGLDSALGAEYNSDDQYYSWQLDLDRAAKASTEEERKDYETKAWNHFNKGYNMDMNEKSFYDVIKQYRASGEITEIKPGQLDAVKKSGKPTLILYVDSNYASDDAQKKDAILLKNFFELCGGREGKVDYKILDIAKWPGYSGLIDLPDKVDRENVKTIPSFELVFEEGKGNTLTDVVYGAPGDIMEAYEVLADPKSPIYMVKWINNNINPNKTFLIMYNNQNTPDIIHLK
jgi:hypothetical protein